MAKYCGKIGFRKVEEVEPGIWEPTIVEKTYYGDLVQFYKNTDSSDKVNDDIGISNQISIVADAFANNNIGAMLYADFMGAKWKIKNIEVKPPRLILMLGGLYNVSQSTGTSSPS